MGAKSNWLSFESARNAQERLASKVVPDGDLCPDSVRWIAGVDASISIDKKRMIGAISLLEWPSLEVTNLFHSVLTVDFPYVPGYLSFREVPVLLTAIEKLPVIPDLFIVDGHGLCHPRRFGLACHLGVVVDIPSIGCAKNHLTGDYYPPGEGKGSRSDCIDQGDRIGIVLRSRKKVKPIWISPGHRMSFDASVDWIERCLTSFRLPEPVRSAHKHAAHIRQQIGE